MPAENTLFYENDEVSYINVVHTRSSYLLGYHCKRRRKVSASLLWSTDQEGKFLQIRETENCYINDVTDDDLTEISQHYLFERKMYEWP